mmetsp:Transcript_74102/g.240943  ORF Transcript_74102/g.240943 Transcript_74102/m.240943 type:complete len:243 (+) Transcript_74102:507-1235(+)
MTRIVRCKGQVASCRISQCFRSFIARPLGISSKSLRITSASSGNHARSATKASTAQPRWIPWRFQTPLVPRFVSDWTSSAASIYFLHLSVTTCKIFGKKCLKRSFRLSKCNGFLSPWFPKWLSVTTKTSTTPSSSCNLNSSKSNSAPPPIPVKTSTKTLGPSGRFRPVKSFDAVHCACSAIKGPPGLSPRMGAGGSMPINGVYKEEIVLRCSELNRFTPPAPLQPHAQSCLYTFKSCLVGDS